MENNIIPIVLATDENYAPYMYVTILSLLENKNLNTMYKIYCFINSSVTKKTKQKMYKLLDRYNTSIHFIDMEDSFSLNASQISHITTPTYYRLKMPEILQEYKKVIYLDTDIIVLQDLKELFNIDIDKYYIAGVKAGAYHEKREEISSYYKSIGLDDMSSYFNAGVALWNLDKIRKDNKVDELYNLVNKNFKSMDQDVINIVFQNKILNINLKYNLTVTTYKNIYNSNSNNYRKYVEIYGENNIKEALKNPVIIHYADKIKPWDKSNSWLAKYWWQYAKNAPFPFWFRKNIFSMSQNSKHYIMRILGVNIKINKNNLFNFKNKIFSIDDNSDIFRRIITIGGIKIKFIHNVLPFVKWQDLFVDKIKQNYQNEISIVAIVKNEELYIKEWIEYHKLIGINKFYIYDNESTDNTKKILEKYINNGDVVYKYYSGRGVQTKAYRDAIKNYKYDNKYMAFIDIDEFLLPIENVPVIDIVEKLFQNNKKAGGVAVQWCVYGSSGHQKRPEGLVIKNYTKHAIEHFDSKYHSNKHVKTICNPRRVRYFVSAHFPIYYNKYLNINTKNNPVDKWHTEDLCWDVLRINHYFSKSFQDYIEKRHKGRVSKIDSKWDMNDFYETDVNDVKDTIILRYYDQLLENIK